MFAKKKYKISGFTLIEILVVLVIISIITAVAMIAFGDFGRGRREKVASDLLQRTIPIAQQQAILQPSILGLTLTDQGYQFFQLWQDPKKRTTTWRKLPDDELSRPNAFGNINVNLELLSTSPDLIKAKNQPKIIFLPNGYITPFKLTFSGKGKTRYQLNVKSNGVVTLKTIS